VSLIERSGGFFGGGGTQWQSDFNASGGQVRVPYSALQPTRYGKVVGALGLPAGSLGNISSFGFLLSFLTADGKDSREFQEGPFALTIMSVEVC